MSSSPIAPAPVDPQRLAGCDLPGCGLPGLFAELPDPRKPRGKRHLIAVVLSVALAAVLAGARSYAAIGQWAREAGPRAAGPLGWPERLPEASAVRRVLSRIDAGLPDDLIGAWTWLRVITDPSQRTVISFGGKTARGAKAGGGTAPHLLAGLAHGAGAVVAQTAVDAKTRCESLGSWSGTGCQDWRRSLFRAVAQRPIGLVRAFISTCPARKCGRRRPGPLQWPDQKLAGPLWGPVARHSAALK
ncbi:MAG: transposase family protein [Propionibacteriaceae bacterium]|jgi:hypothetical protein|nr:transposase family protein [Propionibacteriaceae bacterium]